MAAGPWMRGRRSRAETSTAASESVSRTEGRMRMTRYVVAAALAVAMASITIGAMQQKPSGAGLRAEIEALHADMTAAFSKDTASVAQFYTEDARILGGGQRFSGAAQVRTYWTQIPAGATWKLDIIDTGGSAAEPWVLGRSTLSRPGSPGSIVDYLSILRRGTDGKLRYHIDMYT